MRFCLMSLMTILIGTCGVARAQAQPGVWNEKWSVYERNWTHEFKDMLKHVQNLDYAGARAQLTTLTKILAELNLLAQETYESDEHGTNFALTRILVDRSRQAAGEVQFFLDEDKPESLVQQKANQQILNFLLMDLFERGEDTKKLQSIVNPQIKSARRWRLGKAITASVVGGGSGASFILFKFFTDMFHLKASGIQYGTAFAVGAVGAAGAGWMFWKKIPKPLNIETNLVAEPIEKCRKLLTSAALSPIPSDDAPTE